jgi:serine/threonine protein kinase
LNLIPLKIHLANLIEQFVDGIIHHDLKHGNVLMTKDNQVKICDFGVSRFIFHDSYASTMVKTHNYQPPKVVQINLIHIQLMLGDLIAFYMNL